MEKELWDKAQYLVDSGLSDLVKHLYAEELSRQLTPEQLEHLGGASTVADTLIAAAPDNMEKMINYFVHLVRKGVILGVRKSQN